MTSSDDRRAQQDALRAASATLHSARPEGSLARALAALARIEEHEREIRYGGGTAPPGPEPKPTPTKSSAGASERELA